MAPCKSTVQFRFRGCLLLLGLVGFVGCASFRTYPEGAIQPEEAARIGGAYDLFLGDISRVLIEEINGQSEMGEWNVGNPYALVIPGIYTLTVRLDETANMFGGVVSVVSDINSDKRNQVTRRRIRLNVEGGFGYRIYLVDSPVGYWVGRVPIDVPANRSGWRPSPDAKECRPALTEDSLPESTCVLLPEASAEAETAAEAGNSE